MPMESHPIIDVAALRDACRRLPRRPGLPIVRLVDGPLDGLTVSCRDPIWGLCQHRPGGIIVVEYRTGDADDELRYAGFHWPGQQERGRGA